MLYLRIACQLQFSVNNLPPLPLTPFIWQSADCQAYCWVLTSVVTCLPALLARLSIRNKSPPLSLLAVLSWFYKEALEDVRKDFDFEYI